MQVLQNSFSVQVAVCHILSKPVLACPIKLNEIIASCITAPLPGDGAVIRIEKAVMRCHKVLLQFHTIDPPGAAGGRRKDVRFFRLFFFRARPTAEADRSALQHQCQHARYCSPCRRKAKRCEEHGRKQNQLSRTNYVYAYIPTPTNVWEYNLRANSLGASQQASHPATQPPSQPEGPGG